MSAEQQKTIEVDLALLCSIRNKLYQESMQKGKEPILLWGTIGRHLKQLDSFLLRYGATVSNKEQDGIPEEIKEPGE